ncbi:hypothetical protein [Flammeovirga pacifica]|uniref:Uncharacterized protein n=1 Tax=Flammeovirga pacifica TaxID=915059 RepID=A0A1S1YX02_FLAPC|nr:hypothetical protein [Flammeovirga pacifica]OHX65423.1 hypothetical protein NH26_03200 [Flammeovirga pacifica]
MIENNFDIKLLKLHWTNDVDDPTDLCAHGHVFVKIGDEIVSDKDSLEVTVSATALYLMRTLKDNYKKDDYASQILPCCGHFIIADDDNDYVNICGCPSGIDWTIIHTEDNKIKHISDNGQEAIIDREQYKKLVLDFADQVENFYKTSSPKAIPTDDFDKKGYLTFWKEWKNLRDEYK